MGIRQRPRRIGDLFGRHQAKATGRPKLSLGRKIIGERMRRRVLGLKVRVLRHFAVSGLALFIGSAGAFAQSGTPNPQDQSGKAAANTAEGTKDNKRKTDEFVEASQAINGPAGNP